jgi:phospholipid-binding lipoprotein MlaA
MQISSLFFKALLPIIILWSSLILAEPTEDVDPYQSFNRASYKFNQKLDKYFARPVAELYVSMAPKPVERGVSNLFANLNELTNVANDLIQLKFAQAANDMGRFVINSTVGLGGLLEVAGPLGLKKSEGEDFGQTLGKWGVVEGPYLMLPLIGPSTFRDAPAKFVDKLTDPLFYTDDVAVRNGMNAISLVSKRAELLEFDGMFSGDSYILVRDVYLQRREYLVKDGVVEDDFDDLDDY